MKKIFSIFAAVLFAGSMLAETSSLVFTAACGGSGTADDDAVWTVTSDGAESNFDATSGIHYGTNKAAVTYLQLATSDIDGVITKVVVNARDAQEKATISVTVGETAFTCSGSAKAANTSADYTFTGEGEGAIVVRVDRGSSMQKAIYVKSIVVTYGPKSDPDAEKTLKSIALSGMTTQFENIDKFVFDGTVTATYSVVKDGVPQDDETREVTPTSVSEPDMTQLGDQEVTVSFTDGDVTKEAKYTITVTEHQIVAGTYNIELNNVLFGTTANVNITAPVSGTKNDVTAKLSFTDEAQTKPRTDATYVRFYTNTSLTLSVPEGFVITNVVFTRASGGDWQGSITANLGSYDDETKSWAGEANEVEFAFGAKNFVASAKVTYATKAAISAPVIAGSAEFFGKVEVSISCETEDVDIYYTIDGTDPTAESTLYEEAFELTESATIKAIAIKGDGKSSIASRKFTKLPSFDSLKDLVDADLEANALIEVSFEDVLIDSIYANKSGARKGVYVPVLDKNEKAIEIYYNNGDVAVPEAWVAGGTISGTIRGKWAVYNDQWEVVPTTEGWTWAELTYKAPTGTAIENTAAETKAQKVVRDGQLYIIRNGVMFNANGTAVK